MRADGTHNRRLTKSRFDRAPAWSPNGKKIAFARGGNGTQPDVWTIGADGDGLRKIAPRAYAPAWSPSGRVLAVGEVRDRGSAVDLVNADGTGRRRIIDDGFAATWSPAGKQLAYVGTTADPETGDITGGFIAVVNADGTGKHVVFTSPEKGSPFTPAWSPDGRQIAFNRDVFDGGPGQIWVVSPSGDGLQKLTSNGEHPTWSPDSRELAYAGFGAGGQYQIYVVRRDGSHRVKINTHCPKRRFCGGGSDPVWHR